MLTPATNVSAGTVTFTGGAVNATFTVEFDATTTVDVVAADTFSHPNS